MKTYIKNIIKTFLRKTPFHPIHMGFYLRRLYFFKTIKLIDMSHINKVLDAGCGNCALAKNIITKYPDILINAYDIDIKTIDICRSKNINVKKMDLKELDEKDTYDFIYSIDVLEHIKENVKVISNIYQTLKPGGYFYIHMPDRCQRRIMPDRLFAEFEIWAKNEHIGEMYNLEELIKIIEKVGFEVIVACHTFGLFGKLAWELDKLTDKNKYMKIILMPLLKFLCYLDLYINIKKGNGLLVLARKK